MPIKIAKNSSSKDTPSNKAEMSSKIPESEVPIPVPFIDKISLIIDYQKAIASGKLSKLVAHQIYNAVVTNLDESEVFKASPKTAGYQISKRIPLDTLVDVKKWPLFQFAYSKELKLPEAIRLEFVPVDLGADGLIDLHIKLMTFLPDGWEHVVKYATITRLDIAVGLPNTNMENLIVLPVQSLTVSTWSSKGKLESAYLGKPSGNQTKIYSRSQKRISKKQNWTKGPEVRVERRLVNLKGLKLSELDGLKNPFLPVAIADGLPDPPASLHETKFWQWELFKDSVKVRQLSPALALLPDALRLRFRKHIADNSKSYWDPVAIWSNWELMLAASKLLKI